MLEKVCDFSYFRTVVSESSQFFAFVPVSFFLVCFFFEFVVLGFVRFFVEIYYFVRLVVLETILHVFALVSMVVSAFG